MVSDYLLAKSGILVDLVRDELGLGWDSDCGLTVCYSASGMFGIWPTGRGGALWSIPMQEAVDLHAQGKLLDLVHTEAAILLMKR